MNYPSLYQEGDLLKFPAWAKYLAKIGHYVAQDQKTLGEGFPRLTVVCSPRIDYAALFTAYGVLCAPSNDDCAPSDFYSINLDNLLSKSVSYLQVRGEVRSVLLGRLESVDYKSGIAELVTQVGGKFHSRYFIERKYWHFLKGSNVDYDIKKGATLRQRRIAFEAYSDYHNLSEIIGHSLARVATRSLGCYLTFVGEKNRFLEEISSLEFRVDGASLTAGILLNSQNEFGKCLRNSGMHIELLTSGRDLSGIEAPVVVIEAGRRLGDQLQEVGSDQRVIVLVAANKRSHNDLVDLVAPMINFRGIHSPSSDLDDFPKYMKAIFIR